MSLPISDIVAALNGWLMTTDADAYVSSLWTRFVPHFGFDHLVSTQTRGSARGAPAQRGPRPAERRER